MKYMEIILAQLSEGYWIYSVIVNMLPGVSNIPKNLVESNENENVICTMYVLCYLDKFFADKYEEWILIEKKAIKWLRINNVKFAEFKERILEFL